MKKLLVILAIVGLIGGVWWLTGDKTNAPGGDSQKESANTYGTGASGVELVEFGDFQCPTCGAFFPIIKEVKEKYKDRITFRFRHFPLQTIHPNARAAHRSAEAAAKQGKFWEMHDKLYETQQSWSSANNPTNFFEELATQIGLNLDQFKNDVASSEVNSIINNDVNLGGNLNVSGTPTFFLDGKEIEFFDINTVEKMSAALDAAIAAKAGQQPAAQ